MSITVREFWLGDDIHYLFSYEETLIGEIGFSKSVAPTLRTEIIGRILPYKVGKIFRPEKYAHKPPPILEPPAVLQDLLAHGAKELPRRTAKIYPGRASAPDAQPSPPIVVTIREFESDTEVYYLLFREDDFISAASYEKTIPAPLREASSSYGPAIAICLD